MLDGLPMPQVVMATLIPFKDVIIHDGIVMPYGVTLGKNMSLVKRIISFRQSQ